MPQELPPKSTLIYIKDINTELFIFICNLMANICGISLCAESLKTKHVYCIRTVAYGLVRVTHVCVQTKTRISMVVYMEKSTYTHGCVKTKARISTEAYRLKHVYLRLRMDKASIYTQGCVWTNALLRTVTRFSSKFKLSKSMTYLALWLLTACILEAKTVKGMTY